MSEQKLLQVKDLHTSFFTDSGEVKAVNGVSFNLAKGKVLGIVGESGSGKSVTAYSIMRILVDPGEITGGQILFDNADVIKMSKREMRAFRGKKVSIIFQDSMTSLNPVFTVGTQIGEAVRLHSAEYKRKHRANRVIVGLLKLAAAVMGAYMFIMLCACLIARDWTNSLLNLGMMAVVSAAFFVRNRSKASINERVVELLTLVGITEPKKRLKQYPHELSGGMRQRVMIAMALACEPDILIADEPTTALDVTIQAQILELIQELQKKLGMAILLITHDLGVIADMCDEIIVMYAGRVCERGTADEIFYNPKHEYTKGLLRSIPSIVGKKDRLIPISGSPVDMLNMPKGCPFAARCDSAMRICLDETPEEIRVAKDHMAACWMNVKRVYDEADGKVGEPA